MTDFFISYTAVDEPWAEWIASILQAAKFTTKIQAWDFRPGQNFVIEMHRAAAGSDRTIAVLSPDYVKSLYATAEWAAAFASDPDGTKGRLVPVLVRETELNGLLAPIIHIRLAGLTEAAARERLLQGLAPGRVRPEHVRFPGTRLFPGTAAPPPDPEAAEDLLASLPLDEVPQPGGLPAGSRMTLAPNPLFVGREEDLKNLARHMRAKETFAVGQIAAASGLGGIGKTQLASEFVHRYGRFFKGGVFWMSFADAAAVEIEVAACGVSLGLVSGFENLPLEQQVRLVQRAWESPLPRLLIFDNCEEEELLRRWRPSFGGSRVLVTSRCSDWDPTLGVVTVQLTTLARPASIELLRRFRPELPAVEPALDRIANELGDLPLALHLAGSFLRKYSNTSPGGPAAYLQALRETDLLDHPSMEGRGSGRLPTEHDAHVGRTFALSLKKLDPTSTMDALAAKLLARAAWFAPGEPIPRSLLLKTASINSEEPITELDAEDALLRLIDLGLVESNDQSDLLMHRLVAAATLAALADFWPQTAPLAEVLRGRGAVPARETCPAPWSASLRQALTPDMVVRWLSQLDPAERPAGRSWICATLGLPTAIAQLFDAGSLHQDDAEVLRDHLSWIALFARAGSSEERHDLVVGLIQARSAEGDGHFADRITAELFPTASEELHDLIVHLLSGVGPLPPFANTSPELLSRLVPLMPALPLVGALFCSPEGALTRSPVLIEAVVARVKEAAVAYPAWGYTVAQIRRHAGLARRLSELAGWERMTPDPEVLKRIGPRELRLLGLAFELDLNLDLDLDRERRETAQTWRGGVARLVPGGDVEALLATPGHPAIEQAHRKCLDLAKRLEREDALPGPPLTAPPNPTLEAFRQWWQQLEALFATLGRLQEDLADLEKKIRWAREELVPRARLYFQQYAALPVDRRPPELEALNEAVRALVESDGVSTRQTYTRFREAFEQVERFHEQR